MKQQFVTPNEQMRRKYLPSLSSRKDLSYESYIDLLKQHGLEINSKCFPSYFKLKNGLEYPGIATDSSMSSNEVLVRVPQKLVLSSFIATQRPELQQVFKERFYHESWAWEDRVLNTYLLYIYGKKQTSNVWYHLVEHLPKEIDIIGFWPEEDLDKFKDLTVKCAAENDRDSFEEEWAAFSAIKEKHQILQTDTFSKQNYKWIFIHLISRCFGKQLQFTSMVPFCELFNHHAVDGHYDVEKLEKDKKQEDQNQNQDTSSITTDGSYLSEDYMEVGEYAYDEIDCQPYTWECKEQLDLDEKEKKSLLTQSYLIQKIMEEKLNWQDSTILLIPHLMERCKMIETEYKAGRKPFQRATAELNLVQESILLFIEGVTKSTKQWKGKEYSYRSQEFKKQQEQKKEEEQLFKPNEQGLIEFPIQEKKKYDNFLLLTGKRDHYEPNNQVYFCYGRNSNRTLLLRYGFAIEGNKYEHMWLSFDIGNVLANFPDTLQMLEKKHLSLRRKFKIKINRLNMELILFFRLYSWSFYGKHSVQQLFQIKSYGPQIAILQQLQEQLESRLKQFQGIYDLCDPNLSYHDYFIHVYHQEKLKILQQHINFMKTLINFLKTLEQGMDINKAKQQFTPQEKFIFRHYLAQF